MMARATSKPARKSPEWKQRRDGARREESEGFPHRRKHMSLTQAERSRTGRRQALSPSVHLWDAQRQIVGQVELWKLRLNARHLGTLADFLT